MNELVKAILIPGSVSVIVSGVLVFLAKTWISERLSNAIRHEYDLRLETHKVEVASNHKVAMEKLRADLAIHAADHAVKFSKLHERSADTIAGTYARLQRCYLAVREYVDDFSRTPLDERREQVSKALLEFQDYFWPLRIYLPEETAERVSSFAWDLRRMARQFFRSVEGGRQNDKAYDAGEEAIEKMESEIPGLFHALENEFRLLLGWESLGSASAGAKQDGATTQKDER